MLENSFEKLYLTFRANYYKRMVEKIGTRDGSLSATEHYCVEIIYLLGQPSISEFANYLNISVPNANYKIGCLIDKDYVIKTPSPTDKREQLLSVTEKFTQYYGLKDADNRRLVASIRQNFSPEEIENLDKTIQKVLLLMEPEVEHD